MCLNIVWVYCVWGPVVIDGEFEWLCDEVTQDMEIESQWQEAVRCELFMMSYRFVWLS